MRDLDLIFSSKAYSEREAWNFLTNYNQELCISIRQLASLWNWHRSKVERFLKTLRSETLIETKIRHGKTTIVMLANSSLYKADNFNARDSFESEIETKSSKSEPGNFNRDSFEENNETGLAQGFQGIEEKDETISRQFQDSFVLKEEKKKRSKKRKEEIKEKTFLKESKKEKNFFGNKNNQTNQLLLIKKNTNDESCEEDMEVLEEIATKLPVIKRNPNSVIAEDVIDWAAIYLPKSADIDINSELKKFKDYQRIKNQTTVKDAVSYFKNWLKKAAEFKQNKLQNKQNQQIGGNYHESFKKNHNNKTRTEFERFFAGGIRALDQFTWS